jgi:hypothetical protein
VYRDFFVAGLIRVISSRSRKWISIDLYRLMRAPGVWAAEVWSIRVSGRHAKNFSWNFGLIAASVV